MSVGQTIVIVGPTASGKTGVAIKLAKEIEQRASQSIDGTFCGYRGEE